MIDVVAAVMAEAVLDVAAGLQGGVTRRAAGVGDGVARGAPGGAHIALRTLNNDIPSGLAGAGVRDSKGGEKADA